MVKCSGSLSNSIYTHITTLNLPPPSHPHPSSFFDPPSVTSGLQTELTLICEKAKEFIHALLPTWAEHHCYRVFANSLAMADLAGWSASKPGNQYGAEALGWDRELWFLTALLHDIGWDAQENLKSRLSFEIFGGIKARELLSSWGATQEIADEVCESIIRHTDSLASTGGLRLMAALAQIGAGHDLRGFAVPSLIHPDDNRTINERWPRLGIAEQLVTVLEDEIKYKPGCLSTKWAPARILNGGMDNVACFKGLEGKAEDDEKWKQRRQTITF